VGGGRDFSHPSRPALVPTRPPMQCLPGLFPGGKAAGAWRLLSTPSSVEVKERVELYLCSPLWAFVACSGVIFTFTFTVLYFPLSLLPALCLPNYIRIQVPYIVESNLYTNLILTSFCRFLKRKKVSSRF